MKHEAASLQHEAARLYEIHQSLSKVAAAMGITARRVYEILRPMGLCRLVRKYEVPLPEPTPAEELTREWLVSLSGSALTIRVFCEGWKISERLLRHNLSTQFPAEWEHLCETRMPRAKRYARGKKLEDQVVEDLRGRGWPYVHRQHLSRGPFDVMAIDLRGSDRPLKVVMIQCKRDGRISEEEWHRLTSTAHSCGAVPVLAKTGDDGPQYERCTAQRGVVHTWQP